MSNSYSYKTIKPASSISDFVDSYWSFQNGLDNDIERIIVPDGRIDLLLSKSPMEPFDIAINGLETKPKRLPYHPNSTVFAISFKLLAVEYLLQEPFANLLDTKKILPEDFWDYEETDLRDFEVFVTKTERKIESLLNKEIDHRKQVLFGLIYASNGEKGVQELSETSHWSSRQINRYFNQQFGLPLKKYLMILRFGASLQHLSVGKLFPELDFSDQAHFIRNVRKLSGVPPKALSKNLNDRFIQLSVLQKR